MSKRLTEYCGYTNLIFDFTQAINWELLRAKIVEKGEWEELYNWFYNKYKGEIIFVCDGVREPARIFHEKPAAEKSKIFEEYLESSHE